MWGTNWIYIFYVEESRPPLWSSGHSSWLNNGDVLCFLWGSKWIYICYIQKKVYCLTCKRFLDNKTTAQIETNVRSRGVNAWLLANSQFASGRSCDRPARLRCSVVFLRPRANAELVPKFHVALHASHAAFPMVTLKFRPNVALLMSD
jgi:hypothetical protein